VEKEAILDNWIVTRRYGRGFMQAQPKCLKYLTFAGRCSLERIPFGTKLSA
jgi:hypothetical protein